MWVDTILTALEEDDIDDTLADYIEVNQCQLQNINGKSQARIPPWPRPLGISEPLRLWTSGKPVGHLAPWHGKLSEKERGTEF